MWRLSLVVLASCGPDVTVEWPRAEGEPSFVWSIDGSRIELDEAVSLDPQWGTAQPLLRDEAAVSASGLRSAAFVEADGEWGAVYVTVGLSAPRRFALPPPSTELDEVLEESLTFVQLLWLDERRLLVQRVAGCCVSDDMTLEVDDGTWAPSPLPSEYSRASVERLSGGLVSIFSSAEGCGALSVVRSDGSLTLGPLDLGCIRGADVTGSADGSLAWLVSECDLTAEGPFAGCPDECELMATGASVCPELTDPRSRLYRWSSAGLELVRDDLPRGARIAPLGDRFAWTRHGQLCVGEPSGAHQCFQLQDSERGG